MRSRPAALLVSSLLLLATAGACSDDGGGTASTTTVDESTVVTGEPAVSRDPCSLLTAEEVADTLGIPITSVDGSATVARCIWAPEAAEIALQMIALPTQQDLELLLGRHTGAFGDPEEVADLGSEAFYFDAEGVARMLVYREGELSFELDLVHKDYPDMTTDHRGALEALARQATDRLG